METIKGKTAFVTGAASGVGLGIAKALGKAGANIVIADVRQKAIDEALPWFAENNIPATGVVVDVTSEEAYAKAADEAQRVFGNIHILCNNAGVEAPMVPVWQNTAKDVDFIVGVNIKGVLNGIRTIVPRMLAHGEPSHIVSTASQSGISVVPGAALYCMTKGGVISLMETLACDLRGTNIGASVYAPGPVKGNLSVSSKEVRPADLSDPASAAPAAPPPPPPPPAPTTGDPHTDGFVAPPAFDFDSLTMPAEIAGERVVRGIERGDLYIFTHSEFKEGAKKRAEAQLRGYPDEAPNPTFMQLFSFLVNNPIYDGQTQVPAFPKK
ncbi:MAG: SDR family NAD(P)-dependent oxidoreductase [Oscillospiraceae bacterium]|jgi:NAD(P)-dependent dehydrogenase (short-subunit alcohol dehydrogenase family)|nr:SDR family NAD(P)-dependent oxidoreductase [Oscillospiraceae bacterium]